MPLDNKIHKLVIEPMKAHTACGKDVMCFYPMSETALLVEGGQDPIRCSTFKERITCEECLNNLKLSW